MATTKLLGMPVVLVGLGGRLFLLYALRLVGIIGLRFIDRMDQRC